jgi:hypothetical protein
MSNTDYLNAALEAIKPLERPMVVHPSGPADPDHISETNDQQKQISLADLQAEAANKLAQEALLADPATMRKLFPTVLNDVKGNNNGGYLDMADIKQGLQNPALSQQDKNYLTVLEKGYDNFTWDPNSSSLFVHHFQHSPAGVTSQSLTMLNRAVDRTIPEDPYYDHARTVGAINGFSEGASAAFLTNKIVPRDKRFAIGLVIVGGIGDLLVHEIAVQKQHSDGTEDKMFDQISSDYKSFVKTFDAT